MKSIFTTINRMFKNNHHGIHHNICYTPQPEHYYFDERKFTLQIDESKCSGCGKCVDRCPGEVFRLKETAEDTNMQQSNRSKHHKYAVIVNPEGCIYCDQCIDKCRRKAIYHSRY
jgi:Ferredoxin